LAKLAIRQITSVDPTTRLAVIDTAEISDSNDQAPLRNAENMNLVFPLPHFLRNC